MAPFGAISYGCQSITAIVSALDDYNLLVVTAMPTAIGVITATEFGTGAVTMVAAAFDDDFVGAGVMFAAALDDNFFSAGNGRGRNGNRGNGRDDKSKLLHDVVSPPVE